MWWDAVAIFSSLKCTPLLLDQCVQHGYSFSLQQNIASKIYEKILFVLQHFFTDLQQRSIKLRELDELLEYDIHAFEENFIAFLNLKSFEEFVSLDFNTITIELNAYEEFKLKKHKALHLIHKILDFATGIG